MKRLRGEVLLPGDIVLTTTTEAVSKAIKAATRSDISHAIVCVQSHSVIDATSEGVQARNTQRMFFEDKCSVYVLRYRGGLSPKQTEAICTFVRSKVGTEYATREAVRTVVGSRKKWTTKQFCSRLVAQAYSAAGITLVADPNYCSPADLKSSPLVEVVENAVETATAEEANRWSDHPDTTELMRNATNALFDGVRQKDKSIQTFEDLCTHLIKHPEDDSFVCGLLEASGYLTVWKVELAKNPWQYDLELMNQIEAPEEVLEAYCRSTLSDELAGPNRYAVNGGQYGLLYTRYRLRAFGLLMELFEVLNGLHERRIETVGKWLETKGIAIAAFPAVL